MATLGKRLELDTATGQVVEVSSDPNKWPQWPKLLDVVDVNYDGRWYEGTVTERTHTGISVSYKGGCGGRSSWSRIKGRDVDRLVAQPQSKTLLRRRCGCGASREQMLSKGTEESLKIAAKIKEEQELKRKQEEVERKKKEAEALAEKKRRRQERERKKAEEEARRNKKFFLGSPIKAATKAIITG